MDSMRETRSFSYSTFRFVTDEIRGTSVPIGVALWSPRPEWLKVRVAEKDERIKAIGKDAYPFIRLIKAKIEEWVKQRTLPYAKGLLSPHSDEWWRHLSGLTVHKVRVSEPRPIDCQKPDEELELLYEAIVAPLAKRKEKARRIDGALRKSLGPLTRELARGEVPGFRGRPVRVRRYKEDSRRRFIVEGVNLAAASAEDDTDSLVSRLQRIREANGARRTAKKKIVVFVGYLASPTGLNGEAALRDWIEKGGEARTFDLVRGRNQLRSAVEQQLARLRNAQESDRKLFR
jgi:hypothetical protein